MGELFLEETASGRIFTSEGLLVLRRISEETGLLTLGCLLNFGPVVNAELGRFGAIESGIAVAMSDVYAEILEGGLNARLGDSESAIVAERSLSLNLQVGSGATWM